MKDVKRNRSWTITYILLILGAYAAKRYGEVLVGEEHRVYLMAFVLFILIGITVIGILLPFWGSFWFERYKGPSLFGTILIVVLAAAMFVPLFTGLFRFNLAFYENMHEIVTVLALCAAVWMNHREFVKQEKEDKRRLRSAFRWTGMGAGIGAVLSMTLKKK